MNKSFILMTIISISIFLGISHASESSEFDQYKSEALLSGKPHMPLLKTGQERKYKTRLREAAAEGANYNGHYKIVWWGCGTNCIDWAIINLQSGVTLMQQFHESCWPYNATDQDPDPENAPEWFEFNISSSLLYSYTCENYTGKVTFDTRRVYQWQNGRLKLLRSENVAY